MFESNTDFDEIFGNSIDAQSTKLESTKRAFENDTSTFQSKKLCVNSNKIIPSTCSLNFLKTPDKNLNSKVVKEIFEVQAGCSGLNNAGSNTSMSQSVIKLPISTRSPLQKIVLRKFPGPAGLLPERKDLNIDIKALEEANTKEDKQDNAVDMEGICSQMSVQAFQEGPWEKMCRDFHNRRVFLLDKYNIAWIKSRAKVNKLIHQKAPFLAAVIQSIECLTLKTAIVTMVLKDTSGQIQATIVHDLYEEYIKFLTAGSVIILKQFGVLTTDRGANHYLTITSNNLVVIYSQEAVNVDNSEIVSKGNINVVRLQKASTDDFLKNINQIKSKHKASLLEQRLNPAMDFDAIMSNLRSAPHPSPSSCGRNGSVVAPRVNFQRTASDSDNKFMSPTFRNFNMRSISSDSVKTIKSGIPSNCSINIRNSNSVINSSNTNLKENANIVECHNTSRFNFKARLNLDKSNPSAIGSKLTNTIIGFNTSASVAPCSQIIIKSDNLEHSAILQNVFEGIDADSLFEDF